MGGAPTTADPPLSGVGPAAPPREHGIDILRTLESVGANLRDRPDFLVAQACRQPVSLHDSLYARGKLTIGLTWFLLHCGLGATNHCETGVFIGSRAGIERPGRQPAFLPSGLAGDEAQAEVSTGRHAFTMHCDLMRPTGRGSITLRSADPVTVRACRSTTWPRRRTWRRAQGWFANFTRSRRWRPAAARNRARVRRLSPTRMWKPGCGRR